MSTAGYAGSFDLFTKGHRNIVDRMAPLYGKFIVMVAVDPKKNYMFNPEERAEVVKEALIDLPNIEVVICVNRYVIRYLHELGAQVYIRGLRNFSDLDKEQGMVEENRELCPHVETIFVPCLPGFGHISSSLVKSHIGADPDWEQAVTRLAGEAVLKKFKEKFPFNN
jgi:pantetheine-phosphate adenylyltransferase